MPSDDQALLPANDIAPSTRPIEDDIAALVRDNLTPQKPKRKRAKKAKRRTAVVKRRRRKPGRIATAWAATKRPFVENALFITVMCVLTVVAFFGTRGVLLAMSIPTTPEPSVVSAVQRKAAPVVVYEEPLRPISVPTTTFRKEDFEPKTYYEPAPVAPKIDPAAKKKGKQRSEAPSGFVLASLVPVTADSPAAGDDVAERKAWPRVLPEADEAARQDALEQLRSSTKLWAGATDRELYLATVYARTSVRRDNGGDFTWKDPAAAKKSGKGIYEYVIGGMDRDFRELIFQMGKRLDARGLCWTINSGFRDDWRQSIASGFKARTGNSLHGGSRVTCGYGCGRAVDITGCNSTPPSAVYAAIDRIATKFGLTRPMKARDPAHVQPAGSWRTIAAALHLERTGEAMPVVAEAGSQRKQVRRAKHVRRRHAV